MQTGLSGGPIRQGRRRWRARDQRRGGHLRGEAPPGRCGSPCAGAGRIAWLQVVRGEVALNGRSLSAGDGAAIGDETELAIEGLAQPSEVLLFDMSRR
ncbi:MAG: pirin family protein, partial [Rhodospirillales bacterium]